MGPVNRGTVNRGFTVVSFVTIVVLQLSNRRIGGLQTISVLKGLLPILKYRKKLNNDTSFLRIKKVPLMF